MGTRATRSILSTFAMAVTSSTGLVGRDVPKNDCAAGSVSTGSHAPPAKLSLFPNQLPLATFGQALVCTQSRPCTQLIVCKLHGHRPEPTASLKSAPKTQVALLREPATAQLIKRNSPLQVCHGASLERLLRSVGRGTREPRERAHS